MVVDNEDPPSYHNLQNMITRSPARSLGTALLSLSSAVFNAGVAGCGSEPSNNSDCLGPLASETLQGAVCPDSPLAEYACYQAHAGLEYNLNLHSPSLSLKPRTTIDGPLGAIMVLDDHPGASLQFPESDLRQIESIINLIGSEFPDHTMSIAYLASDDQALAPDRYAQNEIRGILYFIDQTGPDQKMATPDPVGTTCHEIGHKVELETCTLSSEDRLYFDNLVRRAREDTSHIGALLINFPGARTVHHLTEEELATLTPESAAKGSLEGETFASTYANSIRYADLFLDEGIKRANMGFPIYLEFALFGSSVVAKEVNGEVSIYTIRNSSPSEYYMAHYPLRIDGDRLILGNFSFWLDDTGVITGATSFPYSDTGEVPPGTDYQFPNPVMVPPRLLTSISSPH